ncbi:Acyl-CoA dehydrogenase, middle domain [Streptomyces sp. ADI96-02]|uniref:acyl-CoA dehydrogenase n=1 Tax=unclassified Streptomyces TaxID=2593676 RepID=UPI000FAC9D8A|nr:acyl-CoA dehydrogenase [Streptomyces sp. ADI96-02]RPK69251.1 Acyl-CoA dehydrogenase, middle domain [Streptomyces sp. ADI96-02]
MHHDAMPLPTGVRPPGEAFPPPAGRGGHHDAAHHSAARFVRFADDLTTGAAEAPLPGGGRTAARFDALAAVAEDDLCAARLVEGHLDAAAILSELDHRPVASGEYWGVWAAEPPGSGLTATRAGDRWVLDGVKRYCSGAHTCTHALVTAMAEDGRRLFAVRTGIPGARSATGPAADAGPARCRPVAGTWQAVGMAGSDSPDVRFTDVPATPVGEVEAYLRRPGFHHGGVGVAACWYGGARAVARVLFTRAERRADPITDAHVGAVDLRLHTAGTVLRRAAEEIDLDPLDATGTAELRALRVRALVAEMCAEVLDHVGRATGAGPLCHDARHARAAADLTVYVRQHHAERDLAALGALIARGGEDER